MAYAQWGPGQILVSWKHGPALGGRGAQQQAHGG